MNKTGFVQQGEKFFFPADGVTVMPCQDWTPGEPQPEPWHCSKHGKNTGPLCAHLRVLYCHLDIPWSRCTKCRRIHDASDLGSGGLCLNCEWAYQKREEARR